MTRCSECNSHTTGRLRCAVWWCALFGFLFCSAINLADNILAEDIKVSELLPHLVGTKLYVLDNFYHPHSLDNKSGEGGDFAGCVELFGNFFHHFAVFFVPQYSNFNPQFPQMLALLGSDRTVKNSQGDQSPQAGSEKTEQTGNIGVVHKNTLAIVSGVSALAGYVVGALTTLFLVLWSNKKTAYR